MTIIAELLIINIYYTENRRHNIHTVHRVCYDVYTDKFRILFLYNFHFTTFLRFSAVLTRHHRDVYIVFGRLRETIRAYVPVDPPTRRTYARAHAHANTHAYEFLFFHCSNDSRRCLNITSYIHRHLVTNTSQSNVSL